MFVKIIRQGHETTYDCKRVSLHPKKPDKNKHICIVVIDVMEQDERTLEIDCTDTEIIYMNNNGKTIDRKIW